MDRDIRLHTSGIKEISSMTKAMVKVLRQLIRWKQTLAPLPTLSDQRACLTHRLSRKNEQ